MVVVDDVFTFYAAFSFLFIFLAIKISEKGNEEEEEEENLLNGLIFCVFIRFKERLSGFLFNNHKGKNRLSIF